MKKQTICFTKDDGSGLRMANIEYFMGILQDFGPGVKLRLTLEDYRPTRSLDQNSTMYWYLTELAEECGMTLNDFKARMGQKYLLRPLLDKNGEQVVDMETGELEMYVPSTADLNTAEMAKFIDEIRMFGIEWLNYELPLPEKNYKINFQEEKKKQLKSK